MRINPPHLFSFSRFGLGIVFVFFILTLAFRGTLPFGDEPDFTVRALELVKSDFPAWTPYYWISGVLQQLNVNSNCVIVASPTEVTARIDAASCDEEVGQVLARVFVILFLVTPVLLLVAFRGFGFAVLCATVKGPPNELNRRIDSLGLSLLLPSMIYYLGLLSHEQFTLMISLFIFFFWGNWLIITVLLGLIGFLDLGNAVVVAVFVFLNVIIPWAAVRLGIKSVGVLITVFLSYTYLNGLDGLAFIGYLPILEFKVNAIWTKLITSDFFDKYPLILRPVIAFMTGVFMTPSGIKILPLYLLYGTAILVMVNRLRQLKFQGDENSVPVLLSVLTTIFFFSFLLPNYANAKYYIFLAPFILYSALSVFSRQRIFTTLVISALMVPVGMILFKI
jgi:hypothetical protein